MAFMGIGGGAAFVKMARHDVERDFPMVRGVDYRLSDEDFNNNCLGFALGDVKNWWEPPSGSGQYWPAGFPDDYRVETVEKIIRLHGFTVEISLDAQPTTDAIAIYAEGSEWTHFACFREGEWKSKLGQGNDVERILLNHFEVGDYGKVVKILCRPIQ